MADVDGPLVDLSALKIDSEPTTQEGWSTVLPPELIYNTVERFVSTDLPTLHALSLTCQALRSYCRPFIFHTIRFPKESGPSVSGTTKIERFARLLSRTPEISTLVKGLCFFSLPVPPYGSQHIASVDEESFCYVLNMRYSALKYVQIDDKPLSWDQLTPKLQNSVLNLLRTRTISRLFVALRSFPVAVLEQSSGLAFLNICGHIMPTSGYTSRIIPIAGKVRPRTLSMCHTPEESLPLLSGGSAVFEPEEIQSLNLGETTSFSFHHYNIVRSTGASLVSMQLRVHTLVGSVPIPMGSLPKLRSVLVSIESREIYIGLEWFSMSLDTRPSPDFGEVEALGLGLRTGGLSSEDTLAFHRALWKDASKEQNRWPNLANLWVGGFSMSPMTMRNGSATIDMDCLGPFKTGGHDLHDHDHDHSQC